MSSRTNNHYGHQKKAAQGFQNTLSHLRFFLIYGHIPSLFLRVQIPSSLPRLVIGHALQKHLPGVVLNGPGKLVLRHQAFQFLDLVRIQMDLHGRTSLDFKLGHHGVILASREIIVKPY
jgi:hypothetical protein